MMLGCNWAKDLRTEIFQLIYQQPVYPKNLYLDRSPFNHQEFRENVIKPQIQDMITRGVYRSW